MGISKLVGLIIVVGFANAQINGFQANNYPQNQVNAWGQACRNFQQQQLITQAAQNQFFAQTFPQIALPPLPFMDVCGQLGGAGGFAHSGASAGAGAGAGAVSGGLGNRFGGSDGAHGDGVHGVSVSTGSFPNGQSGTSVTHFGPGGASTTHYGGGQPNGGNFATANRFGSGTGGNSGASFSSFSGSPGNGGFATANRFGDSGSGGSFGASSSAGNGGFGGGGFPGVGVGSFGGGGNGGNFATASRFGGADGGQSFSAHGQHGAGVSVSSTNDGHGNVQTHVHRQQY